MKNYKLPGSKKISAKLIQTRSEVLHPDIHKHNEAVWSKEEWLISGRRQLLHQFPERAIKLIVVRIVR
jgi:hypothetical protein